MPAPTDAAFAETEASTASGVNLTTASITWQANDVVIVVAGDEGGSGGNTFSAPTTTGSGLTFTQQKLHNSAGSDGGAGCWAGVASAGSSGTISIKETEGTSPQNIVLAACIARGSAGIGNSALSTGSSRTVSLTPSGADGLIVWIVIDWAAAAVQSFTPTPTSHSSSSPGPTASPVSALVSGAITYYVGELDDQTSAGAVSYGIGGSGTGPFTIIAIEAMASASGGSVTIPDIVIAPMIPGGNR